jgi:hypothetical protein
METKWKILAAVVLVAVAVAVWAGATDDKFVPPADKPADKPADPTPPPPLIDPTGTTLDHLYTTAVRANAVEPVCVGGRAQVAPCGAAAMPHWRRVGERIVTKRGETWKALAVADHGKVELRDAKKGSHAQKWTSVAGKLRSVAEPTKCLAVDGAALRALPCSRAPAWVLDADTPAVTQKQRNARLRRAILELQRSTDALRLAVLDVAEPTETTATATATSAIQTLAGIVRDANASSAVADVEALLGHVDGAGEVDIDLPLALNAVTQKRAKWVAAAQQRIAAAVALPGLAAKIAEWRSTLETVGAGTDATWVEAMPGYWRATSDSFFVNVRGCRDQACVDAAVIHDSQAANAAVMLPRLRAAAQNMAVVLDAAPAAVPAQERPAAKAALNSVERALAAYDAGSARYAQHLEAAAVMVADAAQANAVTDVVAAAATPVWMTVAGGLGTAAQAGCVGWRGPQRVTKTWGPEALTATTLGAGLACGPRPWRVSEPNTNGTRLLFTGVAPWWCLDADGGVALSVGDRSAAALRRCGDALRVRWSGHDSDPVVAAQDPNRILQATPAGAVVMAERVSEYGIVRLSKVQPVNE